MKTLNTILNFHRPLKAPQAPPLIFFKFTEGGCHRLDLLVTKKGGPLVRDEALFCHGARMRRAQLK